MANDETLWRSLLRVRLREPSCSLAPRKVSWKQEYKRVYYHSPVVHTETLSEHTDEVLHVSFAHGGHLFSTTSKDATLRVNLTWAATLENLSIGAVIHLQFLAYGSWDSLFPISMSANCKFMSPKHYF